MRQTCQPSLRALAQLIAVAAVVGCAPGAPRAPSRPFVPDRIVVLTFDDAVRSHYTTVAPLLEKYGFGATFFVTEFPQPPFSDTTLYMTWRQIGDLGRRGFEIGNHTGKHTHVDKMDRAQFDAELSYIETRVTELDLPKPTSFAYPAYVNTPAAVAQLRERGYRFARVGGARAYDPARDDPMLVPSFSTTGDNRRAIIAALQTAKAGKIVVLTVHGVPDTAHPWVTTPLALFEEYLRWLKEHRYSVIAMRDLATYVSPRP